MMDTWVVGIGKCFEIG